MGKLQSVFLGSHHQVLVIHSQLSHQGTGCHRSVNTLGIRRLQKLQNQFSLPFLLLLFAEALGILELRNRGYIERHVVRDALGIILDARNEMLVHGLSDQNEFCLHFVGVFFLYTLHLN